MVRYAHYPELTERSLTYLRQRRVIFTAIPMFLTTLDHVAFLIVVQKPTGRRDKVQRFPSWMSKQHPVFCTHLKRISDGHQYTDEPFDALADFEVIIEKARKQGSLELFFSIFPILFSVWTVPLTLVLSCHSVLIRNSCATHPAAWVLSSWSLLPHCELTEADIWAH